MAASKEYLHQEFDLAPGETVEVNLAGNAANVMLLDPANFEAYREGRPFRYYGGYAPTSPFRIVPPGPGRWHLVVDLGGGPGSVQASASVISGAAS